MPAERKPNPHRDAARELARRIGNMTAEQRQAIAPACPIMTVEGRPLSPINALLVAGQCNSATIVGGFRQWIKAGRCVRQGEHGLWIWVPTTTKGPGVNIITGGAVAEVEETRFIMAPVFDVSQTAELDAVTHDGMGARLDGTAADAAVAA